MELYGRHRHPSMLHASRHLRCVPRLRFAALSARPLRLVDMRCGRLTTSRESLMRSTFPQDFALRVELQHHAHAFSFGARGRASGWGSGKPPDESFRRLETAATSALLERKLTLRTTHSFSVALHNLFTLRRPVRRHHCGAHHRRSRRPGIPRQGKTHEDGGETRRKRWTRPLSI